MNKFFVFACIFAVYACLVGAATDKEIEDAAKDACKQVRKEAMFSVKSSFRNSMISATATPKQRFCAIRQIATGTMGLNQAINAEEVAAQNEYQALTPEEQGTLNVTAWTQQLQERCAKAAENFNKEAATLCQ